MDRADTTLATTATTAKTVTSTATTSASVTKPKQRIRYFDIAKGIGILAVILGHTLLETTEPDIAQVPVADFFYRVCFSFHMPLFFLLSGYFMHPRRAFRWKKESRELLATYGITAGAVLVFGAILAFIRRTGTLGAIWLWLKGGLYGVGDTYTRDLHPQILWEVHTRIGAIWFLLALFWAHLIVTLAYKTKVPWLVVILSATIGFATMPFFLLPWGIQAGMVAALFVYIGYLLRTINLFGRIAAHSIPMMISVAVCAIIWACDIYWFSGFAMAVNQYGTTPILTFAGAIAGPICVVALSMAIDKAKFGPRFLSTVGRSTLAILCVHLLEDDVFPWGPLLYHLEKWCGIQWLWLPVFIVRVAVDLFLAYVLYKIPRINALFDPWLQNTRSKDTGKKTVKANGQK